MERRNWQRMHLKIPRPTLSMSEPMNRTQKLTTMAKNDS
jgi:hypothetical protein